MKQGRRGPQGGTPQGRSTQGIQTSFPFITVSEKGRKGIISLNKEKFVRYLLKSIEIEFAEAEKLYKEIEEELSHFHGANQLEFLEKILSSKIEPYSAKKSEPKSRIKLTDNARVVLRKRYLLRKPNSVLETPEELFRRVAQAIAEPDRLYGDLESKEKVDEPDGRAGSSHNDTARPFPSEMDLRLTEEKFYKMMSSLEFLPNSPTLMNAGKAGGQLAACFVLPIEDSVDSIFETLKQTAIIQKSGGGTGFNFSKLRPKNSFIQTTQGLSSGPISFISIFNSVTDTIKQGGTRRGANMAILNIDHPDIVEFIHCKETGGLVNFNISVAVTDAFMKAVKGNEKQRLIHPQTGTVVEELNAEGLFNQIVEAAWKTGDPGLLFIDRVNEFNPTPHVGKIESTNPCVVGDSLISTEQGFMTIKEITERFPTGGLQITTDNRVSSEPFTEGKNGVTFYPISQTFKTGRKPVFKLLTESGYELLATEDHKIMTTEGWVKMSDLQTGRHKVMIQSGEGKFSENNAIPFNVKNEIVGENGVSYHFNLPSSWSLELGHVLGWLIGDGWLRDADKNYAVGFTFSKEDRYMLNYLWPVLTEWYGKEVKIAERKNGLVHLLYHSKCLIQFFKSLGVQAWQSHTKEVPHSVFGATKEAIIGFLQALFTADGTVRQNPKKNSGWIALTSKSKMLLKQTQLLLLNFGIKSKIYDRSRPPRSKLFSYTTKKGELRFYQSDGILYELGIFGKSREIFRRKIGFLDEGKNKKLNKIEFTQFYQKKFEDEIVSIENIGEETVYDLTEPFTHSMIVNGIVAHQCGEQPILPYESCNLGSINLNTILKDGEIDWEKLSQITKAAVHFLDNVIDVNAYPIPQIEAITKANRKIGLGVMGLADLFAKKKIAYNSQEALNLADKLMSFIREKAIEASEELASKRGAFQNFKGSIHDEPGRKPLRNATVTTIAPTGTLSLIAGCSSGIEPIFARSYIKEVLEGEKLLEVHPEGIPTAHEISLDWHVRMQAVFQKYSDSAVSKTVNLPHNATVEDVRKAYLLAHELGCKGITIFRDRSKETQVLNIPPKDSDLICPECKTLFKHEEACTYCPSCGYMRCY